MFSVGAGGGVVERRVKDDFQVTVERALDVDHWDPVAYGAALVAWRLNPTFGIAADYRYQRIFPEKSVVGLGERDSYASHRATGGVVFSF